MTKLTVKASVAPAVLFLETQIPAKVVVGLNKYLNKLLTDKNKRDYGPSLVGQIKQGEQLLMEHEHKSVKPLTDIVSWLTQIYLEQFARVTGLEKVERRPGMHSMWSVHSYAGDYNPLHDHGTHTQMGISFTTWTMVPPQIANKKELLNDQLFNASGACDGFLEFYFGKSSVRDREELKPSFARSYKPEVGRLLLFPSWCQHCVFPFKGEGERRTIAGNLNMLLPKVDTDTKKD